jgi:capsid protein
MQLVDRVHREARRLGRPRRRRYSIGKRFFAAGAQINRLTTDWIRSATTPDLEVRADIRVLRRRARELVRDNAYARRFT